MRHRLTDCYRDLWLLRRWQGVEERRHVLVRPPCVDIQERRLQSTMDIAICHQNNNWNWCWVISFNFRNFDMSNYVINKNQPRPVYNLIAVSVSSMAFLISRFRNSTENGYKLCVQWFLGLFGRTNVSYDSSVVVKATTQAIPEIVAPKACTHSPCNFWSRK